MQKEWLAFLGYYHGAVNGRDSPAYRAALSEYAADKRIPASQPLALHKALKRSNDRNRQARIKPCKEAVRDSALACVG